MNIDRKEFPDQPSLTHELAKLIGKLLTMGIEQRGLATLVVSGGSTPIPLFKQLSSMEIPWLRVVITLVDERWVATSASDSNENLIQTHLLKDKAMAATYISLKNRAGSAEKGMAECERRLKKIPRPFDVVILGMGEDGHTASLFPGTRQLRAATDIHSGKICMAITPVSAPHERMTLTLPTLLDSRQILLHITGDKKRETLQKAMADGPVEQYPIRYILGQTTTPVSIFWAP